MSQTQNAPTSISHADIHLLPIIRLHCLHHAIHLGTPGHFTFIGFNLDPISLGQVGRDGRSVPGSIADRHIRTAWQAVNNVGTERDGPFARAVVMANPMPRPPPVMRTSFPLKSMVMGMVLGSGGKDRSQIGSCFLEIT